MTAHPARQNTKQQNMTTQGNRNTARGPQNPVSPEPEVIGLPQTRLTLSEPKAGSPRAVLQLQRLYGNRAIARLLRTDEGEEPQEAQHLGPMARISETKPRVQRYTTASLRQQDPLKWQEETLSVTRPGEGVSGGVFFFKSDEEVVIKPDVEAVPAGVRAMEKALQATNIPVAESMRIVPATDPEAEEIRQTVRDKIKLSPEQTLPGFAGLPEAQREEIEGVLSRARNFFAQPKVGGAGSLASLLHKADSQEKVNAVIAKLSSPTFLNQLGRLTVIDVFMGMSDRIGSYLWQPKINLGNIMISGDEAAGLVAIDNEAKLRKLQEPKSMKNDPATKDMQTLLQDPDRMIDGLFQMIREDYLAKLATESFNPATYFEGAFDLEAARTHIKAGVNQGVADLNRLVTSKSRKAMIKEVVVGQEGPGVYWETFRARGAWIKAYHEGATPEQAMAQATQYLQARRAYREWKNYIDSMFKVPPEIATVPPKPRGLWKKQAREYAEALDIFSDTISRYASNMEALRIETDKMIPQAQGTGPEAPTMRRKLRYIKANVGKPSAEVVRQLHPILAQWLKNERETKNRTKLLMSFKTLQREQQALTEKIAQIPLRILWEGRLGRR